MKSLSRIHIWFPNTDHKIENIVKSCQNCENVFSESDKSQHTHGTGQQSQWIEYTNILIITNIFKILLNSYSKWLDFEIVRHCDTKNTILCLSKWFSQYGIPAELISDNGTQYSNCCLSSKFKLSSREIC